MAKVLGPDFIALQGSDLPASKRFYIERLGLEPADGPFGRCFAISDPDGYTLTPHEAA